MISFIHDLKFNFAKAIPGETVLWTKVSKGTIMGKTVLIKCISPTGTKWERFVKFPEGKELLKDPNKMIDFMRENENFQEDYDLITKKGHFYFNGMLIDLA